jgi:magnesium-transporting ATPase (P-type)
MLSEQVGRVDPRERIGLLLRDLRSSRQGLSAREARRRLVSYGPNELRREKRAGWRSEIAAQLSHPLALLLWVAAVLALVAGIPPLAGAIVAVILERASLAQVGLLSNRLLLWGIAFELAFAAAVIYVPPLQAVFGTAALEADALLFVLPFPLIVWGADELRRARLRRSR